MANAWPEELTFTRERRFALGRIGLMPLIDVIFQLLIFFAVTMSFTQNRGMNVSLPESSTAITASSDAIVVTIDHTGAFFVEGIRISDDRLVETLRAGLATDADAAIRIDADRLAAVERAVRALDAARIAGGKTATLSTDAPPAP